MCILKNKNCSIDQDVSFSMATIMESTMHRERGNKVIKSDEHNNTFLTSFTSGTPVFSLPLHVSGVCVCVVYNSLLSHSAKQPIRG